MNEAQSLAMKAISSSVNLPGRRVEIGEEPSPNVEITHSLPQKKQYRRNVLFRCFFLGIFLSKETCDNLHETILRKQNTSLN